MLDRIVNIGFLIFFVSIISFAIFGSMHMLEKEQECREKGGIPERGICLHPSAVIK